MGPQRPISARTRIALGDDALILGQRLAEWVSNAPSLEEELALANVALDHIGRARMFYGHAAEIAARRQRRRLDRVRPRLRATFTNLLINELPRGDFAFTMVRQFLVDAFNVPFLTALAGVERTGARRHRREGGEGIHIPPAPQPRLDAAVGRRHGREPRSRAARRRRAMGLHARAVRAVRRGGAPDCRAVWLPDRAALETRGATKSLRRSHEATLRVPEDTWSIRGGRDGVHTEHLGYLLAEMQFMQRAYPGQRW